MKLTILDGYVDEPTILGVPPYISPYVREVAGVCREVGLDYKYMTIDQWREGGKIEGDILVLIGGAVVPGRYLRTYPASTNEIRKIMDEFKGMKILGGGIARYGLIEVKADYIAKKDVDALLYDLLTENYEGDRYHTLEEWNRWLKLGAEVVKSHPDFPKSLIVEIETFRGCARYISGGCSFCIEPLYGKPIFRDEKDIIEEVKILSSLGVRNFRIGGQSCIYSYKAFNVGKKETVEPNVDALKTLFEGLHRIPHKVLHVDNANPAVISSYPEKARKITEILVKYTTPGNVVALGMESADPEVIKKNNLNASPQDVMSAIEIVNEIGSYRGENGMPHLLPGLNFICGLRGERKETYELNFKFLKEVLNRGYLLRRINIRHVAPIRGKFKLKYKHECWKFRDIVRKEIDSEMLRRIVPPGTVLRNVYMEINRGNYTFGRQIGSYPLIVVLPYRRKTGEFVDVKIFDYGERSVTGVEYPLDINKTSFSVLKSLPGIGDKRAARIVRSRPFQNLKDAEKIVGKAIEYFI